MGARTPLTAGGAAAVIAVVPVVAAGAAAVVAAAVVAAAGRAAGAAVLAAAAGLAAEDVAPAHGMGMLTVGGMVKLGNVWAAARGRGGGGARVRRGGEGG
jgi:hypothetical protein